MIKLIYLVLAYIIFAIIISFVLAKIYVPIDRFMNRLIGITKDNDSEDDENKDNSSRRD